MPHIPGLLYQSSGRYVLNIRVPKELRGKFGKADVIRKALGTSDWREAVSRLRYESHKLEVEFAEKRRELKLAEESAGSRRKIDDLSEQEVHALVSRWFIKMVYQDGLSRWRSVTNHGGMGRDATSTTSICPIFSTT
jgi:hypothetical protein